MEALAKHWEQSHRLIFIRIIILVYEEKHKVEVKFSPYDAWEL